ncbi:cytochrome c oxidase subunit II [Stutzerimonas azotifigens]|uniref:cytochrome c oxidase subunit II n=1 Tax=Stutzerimonas azotifigens TaxID=291995 RepID=UPI001EECF869|nr:cytochrome c oxidase subunit II [Stutzerimonas azotifigens]
MIRTDPRQPRRYRAGWLLATTLSLAGCEGRQSALAPAGAGAERIAELFWWMTVGSLLIWALVIGLALYVTRAHPEAHGVRSARWLIIGGGVVFPTTVLTALLIYGLMLIPELRATGDIDRRIEVAGEQWWWRVRYPQENGEAVELANEIRLPLGERILFRLSSPDVIHSFWIPSLAGKVDMIPGRITELVVEPTRTGTFRGACAEYCGASHALMNFQVVVMEPDAYRDWLAHQATLARAPTAEQARRGQQAFLANGCGACHTVRGTPADGRLGPDLTHVGSRLGLGADALPNDREALIRWIGHTGEVKPDVRMPAFGMLPVDELAALAAYLSELE